MQAPKWLQSRLEQTGEDWTLRFTKKQLRIVAVILIVALLGFGVWGIARQV